MSQLHLTAAAAMLLAGAARPDDRYEGDFLFGIGDLAHMPLPDPFAFPNPPKIKGRRYFRSTGRETSPTKFDKAKAARKRQRKARAVTRRNRP